MTRFFLAVALLATTIPALADTGSCQERAAAGDLPGTISACSAALESNPEDATAWATRGIAHAHSNTRDQAMIDFDRALGIDPRLVAALSGRAQLHYLTGNSEAALADLTAALAIEPKNGQLLQQAAETSYKLGQKKETIAFLERAAKADPQNPEPWLSLSSLHEDQPKQREKYLDSAVRASNSSSRALHLRGHFHENNKKPGKAVDDFRAAIRISPADSHLYADLSRALRLQGKDSEAMSVLDQGLALKVDARLLNQRLPLRLAANNPLGAADDLRAWYELGTPPQGDRQDAQITQALYEKYAPGLHAAISLTENLQAPELNCDVSESVSAWLEALSTAGGQVAKARESLANQQTERHIACLEAAQPQPTAKFAEARQLIAAANSRVAAGRQQLNADCGAFPLLAQQCAQLAEAFQQQASELLANLRQHEETASMRRLGIAEQKRDARSTALAAIDKASASLDRSANALFAEHIDTATISRELSRSREHSAPNVTRDCPSPTLRAPSTDNELSTLNRTIEQHRNCLDQQYELVQRRMPGLDQAAEALTEQRNLLDAFSNHRCSRNSINGCIADDTWTRASNLLTASAVSSARSNRDAHRNVLDNSIPTLTRQLDNQIDQINAAVESHNRAQAINEAVNTFSDAFGQASQQNQGRGSYFPNSSTSAPGIR